MNHWLVKSEPETYSWEQLNKDKSTVWDGVRNFAARIHLRAMKIGDQVLYYHSGDDKAVVGIAKVVKEAYQDPTTGEDWTAVDLAPVQALKNPVSLAKIKGDDLLKNTYLVRQGRLSVMPLTKEEFNRIVEFGS